MKKSYTIITAIGCALLPTSLQAALTWDNVTFTSLGGSSVTNNDVSADIWSTAQSQETLLNDASGTITGYYTATESLGDNNTTLSANSIIDFSFTNNGGSADLNFTTNTVGGSAEWYRMVFEDLSSDVTSIDYSFEYREAVTAASTTFTLVGARADTDVDSVLTYTVLDENLQGVDLQDALWVTGSKSNAQFFNPENADAGSISGDTATLNIAADGNLDGLGYAASDNTFSNEVAGVNGSISATDGGALGTGSYIQFTFNGNFTGTEVVPEPSSIALLGLGFSAFILRRNRR